LVEDKKGPQNSDEPLEGITKSNIELLSPLNIKEATLVPPKLLLSGQVAKIPYMIADPKITSNVTPFVLGTMVLLGAISENIMRLG
jgi:hypothetical protein